MKKAVKIGFVFRKPEFPVICDFDGRIVSFMDPSSVARFINDAPSLPDGSCDVIDATGEGWTFYPDRIIFSPLTIKNRWKKKEIIDLYNNRVNNGNGKRYVLKNPDSKKLTRVIQEIVEMLEEDFSW